MGKPIPLLRHWWLVVQMDTTMSSALFVDIVCLFVILFVFFNMVSCGKPLWLYYEICLWYQKRKVSDKPVCWYTEPCIIDNYIYCHLQKSFATWLDKSSWSWKANCWICHGCYSGNVLSVPWTFLKMPRTFCLTFRSEMQNLKANFIFYSCHHRIGLKYELVSWHHAFLIWCCLTVVSDSALYLFGETAFWCAVSLPQKHLAISSSSHCLWIAKTLL